MSELIYFQEAEDRGDVHERGVKLEVLIGRTDVVAGTKDTNQDQ